MSLRPHTFIIGAGEEISPGVAGDYVRVKSLSSGVLLRVHNENGNDDVYLEQNDAAELEQFDRLYISHDSAAKETIELYIGKHSKVISSQFSGYATVTGGKVQPVGGADNTATPPVNEPIGGVTNLANPPTVLPDISKNVDLTNATPYTATNTTVTIAAGTNVNGLIIWLANAYVNGAITTGSSNVTVNGIRILFAGEGAAASSSAMMNQRPIYVPPGIAVSLASSVNGATANAFIQIL